ncbi:(R)-mandelonitrile lyase-like [Linum perenne]
MANSNSSEVGCCLRNCFLSYFLAVFFLFHGCRLSASQQDHNYTFVRDATAAPVTSYYDYIIVGGGTAGCPLAATLSQNATVLLLERGGSPYGDPNITYLANFGAPLADASPSSPSQRFISEDGVINSRPRVLGGGSCLNAGFYSRAGPDYIRDVGWNAELAESSYEWVEKKVAFQPPMGRWQSAVRDGLVEVGIVPNNGFTYNHIYGTKVGGSIFDSAGHRHTAADLLDYANPDRLTVLLKATAHKIMFQTRQTGKARPTAHGVLYRDSAGVKHKAYLNRGAHSEIIISAGSLGSPQLLMLSGVGPTDQLKAHNITVILENSMVVPPKQRTPEALERAIYNMSKLDRADFRGGFILEKIMGPLSTGHLELTSRNPNENPSVTFNYFKHPEDLNRCVQFRYDDMPVPRLLNMTARAPVNMLPRHNNTSASLEQFCKDTVMTIWHYHGGCQVGEVVEPDYRVLGVDALRVIDGSTFNASPGTNPQATVMMLGR